MKATSSANHVLQERQTEGKEAHVGEGNYTEESDLENEKGERGGGGGGGGGGGCIEREDGHEKGQEDEEIWHRAKISSTVQNFAQAANFAHYAKFRAGG